MADYAILKFDELTPVDRGTGVVTRLIVHKGLGSEHLTNGITRFDPGAKIAVHWHNCDESVVIIEGDALAEVAGKTYPMTQYDTTFVKAGVPHRFSNVSDKPMAILFTYGAAQVTRTFADSGITVEHMSVDDKAVATGESR